MEIALPPLRERVEDLPELTKHFLTRFPEAHGRRAQRIDDDTVNRLQEYLWPGNVNELASVLHEAVLRCDGDLLQMRHLPPFDGASRPQDSPMDSMRLEDVVERHVLRVLKDCGATSCARQRRWGSAARRCTGCWTRGLRRLACDSGSSGFIRVYLDNAGSGFVT